MKLGIITYGEVSALGGCGYDFKWSLTDGV